MPGEGARHAARRRHIGQGQFWVRANALKRVPCTTLQHVAPETFPGGCSKRPSRVIGTHFDQCRQFLQAENPGNIVVHVISETTQLPSWKRWPGLPAPSADRIVHEHALRDCGKQGLFEQSTALALPLEMSVQGQKQMRQDIVLVRSDPGTEQGLSRVGRITQRLRELFHREGQKQGIDDSVPGRCKTVATRQEAQRAGHDVPLDAAPVDHALESDGPLRERDHQYMLIEGMRAEASGLDHPSLKHVAAIDSRRLGCLPLEIRQKPARLIANPDAWHGATLRRALHRG